jgi:short-subunit dehydrogenase
MDNLANRVAVVTGAAGGIGRAVVLELARAGMHLVLAGRTEKHLVRLADEVRALGSRCSVVRTDVGDAKQLDNLLARTLADHGRCDVLVNNAGILKAAPLFGVELREWKRVLDINLWGVLHGCNVFGRYFADRGEGHIVNVASWSGLMPAPGMTMYSTGKFAVVGFTHQLRWELAPKGVGVSLVVPGLVDTPILDRADVGLSHMPTALVMRAGASPQRLAKKIRRAIQKNRGFITYGVDAALIDAARHLPHRLLDTIGKGFARIVLMVVREQESREAPEAEPRELLD